MDKFVAKNYGDALFELALENDKLEVLIEEIRIIENSLKENKELEQLMNHPNITKIQKAEIIDEIFKDRVSDELTGFFKLIVSKGRYSEITYILEHFSLKVKSYKKIGFAFVSTAIELREEQKKQLEDKLLQITRYKQLEMNYQVDKTLIGGMRIQIGDRIIDNSIKTKLEQMAKQLSKIQL